MHKLTKHQTCLMSHVSSIVGNLKLDLIPITFVTFTNIEVELNLQMFDHLNYF